MKYSATTITSTSMRACFFPAFSQPFAHPRCSGSAAKCSRRLSVNRSKSGITSLFESVPNNDTVEVAPGAGRFAGGPASRPHRAPLGALGNGIQCVGSRL